jgi:hypothetical protein
MTIKNEEGKVKTECALQLLVFLSIRDFLGALYMPQSARKGPNPTKESFPQPGKSKSGDKQGGKEYTPSSRARHNPPLYGMTSRNVVLNGEPAYNLISIF